MTLLPLLSLLNLTIQVEAKYKEQMQELQVNLDAELSERKRVQLFHSRLC